MVPADKPGAGVDHSAVAVVAVTGVARYHSVARSSVQSARAASFDPAIPFCRRLLPARTSESSYPAARESSGHTEPLFDCDYNSLTSRGFVTQFSQGVILPFYVCRRISLSLLFNANIQLRTHSDAHFFHVGARHS